MHRLPLAQRSTALTAAVAVVAALALAGGSAGAPAPRPGAPCAQAGARSGQLSCVRNSRSLVWKLTQAKAPATSTKPRAPVAAATTAAAPAADPGACTKGTPPLLRNIGVALGAYDPATESAGAFRFTHSRLDQSRLFMGFGYVIPNAQGGPKANPQPSFIVPQGTPVTAMVDGVVSIHELWSTPTLGDVSVMISCTGTRNDSYSIETEHVTDLTVKAGERVKAGQVIAHAGPLSNQANSGLYVVEIGILTGDGTGRPVHLCPFASLHPSVRDTILEQIRGLTAAWETYRGDPALYDEAGWAGGVPGCGASGGITE